PLHAEVRVQPGPQHQTRDGTHQAVPPGPDQENREEKAGRRAEHQAQSRVTEALALHGLDPSGPSHGAPGARASGSVTRRDSVPERGARHSSSMRQVTQAVSGSMSRFEGPAAGRLSMA